MGEPNTEKEYTTKEVAAHDSQDDCWMVIGNETNGGVKVYDVTSYLDDHPGGGEVLLDVGGKNADEFFEDIGHSRDARNELAKHQVGILKMSAEEIEEMKLKAEKEANATGGASNLLIIIVIIVAIALGYYKSQM